MGESGSWCEVCLCVWILIGYIGEKVWFYFFFRGNSVKFWGGICVVGCYGRWSSKNFIN